MSEWTINEGAIVERPRDVESHPLLAEIYRRQDALISAEAIDRGDRVLEVAFGRHPHPDADVGIEAFPENAADVDRDGLAAADARDLPFEAGSFDVVVGRRFLHHVPREDRGRMVEEAARVLEPDGTLVLLEGTPGAYRRFAKGLGFRLGLLGEDNDEYGHLAPDDLETLMAEHGFEVVETRPLGSPLVPVAVLRAPWTARLAGLHDRMQWITWWTMAIGEPS